MKDTGISIDATKESFLEVNAEKTNHMLPSRCQSAGLAHDMWSANNPFENGAQYKFFKRQ